MTPSSPGPDRHNPTVRAAYSHNPAGPGPRRSIIWDYRGPVGQGMGPMGAWGEPIKADANSHDLVFRNRIGVTMVFCTSDICLASSPVAPSGQCCGPGREIKLIRPEPRWAD